jgi:hypothetical protein
MGATRWGGVLCGVGSAINLIYISTHVWAIWIVGVAVLGCGIAFVVAGFFKRR